MGKKKLIGILLFLFSIPLWAQEKDSYATPGQLRAMGTISPSMMLGSKGANFYLHGNMEYYFNKRVSFCGDLYGYAGTINNSPVKNIEFSHNLFYGFIVHNAFGRNDTYLAIQPGIALTKLYATTNTSKKAQVGINPIASAALGHNFFVNNFFHFFVQTRLIVGEHHYDTYQNLTELRLSAGLGFNIQTQRK